MAFVFQPDPTLANFNAFCSVAFADDYFSMRLQDTWAAQTNATKESAIAWASVQLSLLAYKGIKTSATQTLAWPRTGIVITEEYSNDGRLSAETYIGGYVYNQRIIGATEIPVEMKWGCLELAQSLITSDTTVPPDAAGIKSLKVDVISLEFDRRDRYSWLTPNIRNLCGVFLLNNSAYNIPVTRTG